MDSGVLIATLCGIGSGAACLVLPGLIAAISQQSATTNQAIKSDLIESDLIESPISVKS
jgi:hypothetical protein